jgi:predicted DNA-binding transcriptional regulator YafY
MSGSNGGLSEFWLNLQQPKLKPMPVNLDALLRYHTINDCLQRHGKEWTWEQLANACAEYADDVAPRDSRNIPSKRTIQNDIKVMRSGNLGYYAPIKTENGKYYYEDPNYSIKNATLNKNDFSAITIAAKVLGQYKGFDFFNDLNNIYKKFESKLYIKLQEDSQQAISFEIDEEAKGVQFLNPLLNYIETKTVLDISYKKFTDDSPKQHIIHPYLLKEFDGRWYLLGWQGKFIITLALDRIEDISEAEGYTYQEKNINAEEYFANTIGVTFTGQPAQQIIIDVEVDYAPYLLTKPLHKSQQLLRSNVDVYVFSYRLVINQELENWLLEHSNHLRVLEPNELKQSLFEKIKKAYNNFS